MKHKWSMYDVENAQIRHIEFESRDGIVEVTLELAEQLLREKGYEPEDEFAVKTERLLKALREG